MSDSDHPHAQPQPLRETIVQRVEDYTREEPMKAASAAFGLGILLALLPIGSLVSGVMRLLFLVARPVLMILGVVKVAEQLDERRSKTEEKPE